MRRIALLPLAVSGLTLSLLATACSSGFSKTGASQQSSGKQELKVLIATSGAAETDAVKAATDAWAKATGNSVTVDIAQNMDQQLGQAFAGDNPPDVFYVSSDQFSTYAKRGALYAYGDQLKDRDAYSPTLLGAFTYNSKLYCAPKDQSTLALAINTDLWQKAGLTAADYPKTWDQLAAVAKKLTGNGVTGLSVNADYNELGGFFKQAGGWLTNADQTKMTASDQSNVQALAYVKQLLTDGVLKFPKDLDAGWGGEAFGKGKAAMTIEGNWLAGAMAKDFPGTPYALLPLPDGPAGKGTMDFTDCWGVATKSRHQAAAVALINELTSDSNQLTFAKTVGVMPSKQTLLAAFKQQDPKSAAWADGASYAQLPVNAPGMRQVMAQFNTSLAQLVSSDPTKLLADLQKNGESALSGNTQ
ncbi:sugar ABC transporter substrate-binding protein [Kitasatospora kifunensis]|uniref:Multiple sugar transport system substrate-binding protein n=1 Tax=Kitasatospora kifunensis TaxID=58351 RepID=A0A7W7VT70_KITKI|nr:extracellular solute-binding protein [Kitasatospora kifunensis]MBB4921359.1 multiple sugar transport system substrate-binding protein [Kitasatospora kifunensis]